MSDRVFIRGLAVDALIGVYPHERERRQALLLDIELGCEQAVAAASDRIADAIDYAQVCQAARDLVLGSEPQLLESLADSLATRLLQWPGVTWARVCIDKPEAAQALGCASVGVEILRGAT